jgi:hypothetical protein
MKGVEYSMSSDSRELSSILYGVLFIIDEHLYLNLCVLELLGGVEVYVLHLQDEAIHEVEVKLRG